MKITCEYCNALFDDNSKFCPMCGAANKSIRLSTTNEPITIDELRTWYTERNLPPYDVTRFYIGYNYNNVKSFGIYKQDKNFYVYKVKENGARVVRYSGTDEAFAVNEFFNRLKREIALQKAANVGNVDARNKTMSVAIKNDGKSATTINRKKETLGSLIKKFFKLYFFGVFGLVFSLLVPSKKKIAGYYKSGDDVYYHDTYQNHSEWYKYNNTSRTWVYTSIGNLPTELQDANKSKDFYYMKNWDASSQVTDFKNQQNASDSNWGSSWGEGDWGDDSWDNKSWSNEDSENYNFRSDMIWNSFNTDWMIGW